MKPITIRIATAADAELIADLSRKTFHETFGYLNTKADMDKFMNEQFSRQRLIEEVDDPSCIFLLAFDETLPVGYVCMRVNSNREEFAAADALEIARIYVINRYIGMGVGKELMRRSIFMAKEMKKEMVWLGVWEKNPKAIAFYEKWGFEKFAEHTFLLGDDPQNDWLMKKAI
jgi:ribosomal protein S18 acetylase RimI-like enzyme